MVVLPLLVSKLLRLLSQGAGVEQAGPGKTQMEVQHGDGPVRGGEREAFEGNIGERQYLGPRSSGQGMGKCAMLGHRSGAVGFGLAEQLIQGLW